MSEKLTSTPANDGFRMPGEHEPQERVWMVWPERADTWINGAKPAQLAFAEVALAISEETPVTMAVSRQQYSNARRHLAPYIELAEIPTNDAWMRDIGPSYVVNDKGCRRGIDWEFNAWGGLVDGLYYPWDCDDAVAAKVTELQGDDHYRAPFVLEGGSVHVDGEGTCYTTEECLLHPGRNPGLSKAEIESYLKQYLNVQKVIWLPSGLYKDLDTNGHVDNLMHVVRPGEIVLSWTEEETDPQYDISRRALKVLESETDAMGRCLKVHKMPVPGPLYITPEEADGFAASDSIERRAGSRLAASYVNFLITNRRIVFPLLDETKDEIAEQVFRDIFPQHHIVGVPSRSILLGGGNIHCITQQVPATNR